MTRDRPQRRAQPPRPRLSATALVGLCLLLAAPGFALSRLAPRVDWRILTGAPVALSVFAFMAYRGDKRRAEAGEWRTPEATLQLLALIGGWPGAFLGQRIYRHKTAKASFQFVFWLVVLLHQFMAVDSLLTWRFTGQVLQAAAGVFAARS